MEEKRKKQIMQAVDQAYRSWAEKKRDLSDPASSFYEFLRASHSFRGLSSSYSRT